MLDLEQVAPFEGGCLEHRDRVVPVADRFPHLVLEMAAQLAVLPVPEFLLRIILFLAALPALRVATIDVSFWS